MLWFRNVFTVLFMAMAFCQSADAQEERIVRRAIHFNAQQGVALKGCDPVSLQQGGGWVVGTASFSQNYDGVTYYFKNKENADAFSKKPNQYEPQCGGWCAYVMAMRGQKIPANGQSYLITDSGMVFLFQNEAAKEKWKASQDELLPKSIANWEKNLQ